MQAAYDSVWHAGLAHKIARLPLPRNLVGWIVDFLRDRKLQAKVAGYLSRQVVVNCGVPQGSPLSPLLYILYTADLLTRTSADCVTEAYADDLTVSATGNNFAEAQVAAQTELDRVAAWARLWRQKFNASKSEVLPFAWQPTTVKLRLNGSEVPQVPVLRILGLFFDPRLNWKAHVDRVLNRCRRNLSWFRRLSWTPGLSRRWRRVAYFALVRSSVTYGNTAFCNASKQQMRRLSVLQNNCLRTLLNVRLSDRVPILELQQRSNVESLASHFERTQRRYVENVVHHVLPLREDVEAVRNSARHLVRSPIAVLNSRLPPGPLPPPEM